MNEEDDYSYYDFEDERWESKNDRSEAYLKKVSHRTFEKEEKKALEDLRYRLKDKPHRKNSVEAKASTSEAEEDVDQIREELNALQERLRKAEAAKAEKLSQENRDLRDQIEAAGSLRDNFITELSYFLGQKLAEQKPAAFDDVEAWAFQDGRNEIIMAVQNWLSKVKETQDAINGPTTVKQERGYGPRDLNLRYPHEYDDPMSAF